MKNMGDNQPSKDNGLSDILTTNAHRFFRYMIEMTFSTPYDHSFFHRY